MGISVGKLVKGVTKGAKDVTHAAGKAVGGAAKSVGRTAEKATKTVTHATGDVVRGVGKATKTVTHAAGDVVHGVGKASGAAAKATGKIGKAAVKTLGKAGAGAAAGVKNVATHAAGAGADMVKGAGRVASGVGAGAGAFLSVVRDAAGGNFKNIPKDLQRAGKSFFSAGKSLVGVAESAGALYIWTNGAFVPVVVAGSAAANVLVKHRSLTGREIEFAKQVFGSLIPYDRIVLTNLHSNDDRAFTIPNVDGDILVNLGPAYGHPIAYPRDEAERKKSRNYPTPGQLFVHELTHAWQIAHSSFLPGLICQGILNQTKHTILKKKGVYDPGTDFTKRWSSFNAEQQGTIIDSWFMDDKQMDGYGLKGASMSERDSRFRYVHDHIRSGKN